MDFLTPGQANKLAKHITNSVTNMVTNKSTAFDQKVAANDQYLLEVQQRYAQVNTALAKFGINAGTDAEQSKTDVLEAAKKLVMTRYAGHGYFFELASWAENAHKLHSQSIEKAKGLCPTKLDPQNTGK